MARSTNRRISAPPGWLADVIQRRGKTMEDTLFERAATILRPLPQRFGYGRLAAYAALADHYKAKRQPADEAHFRRLGTELESRRVP